MNLIEQDKAERALALDASQSFIVQAPAGSGKTELLIQRFLTLLHHVKTPEEILAITFTKKAANEMRHRVIKALKNALTEAEPDSAHAKQTWRLAKQVLERDQQFKWHLIDNPNQLRIQTIDSLCAFLTKQLPLLSHFGSQPSMADVPSSLYKEAAHEVLMHVEQDLEWSQAISNLLLHLDNDLNKLHALLVTLLAKRDQWLPYIHFNSSTIDIKKHLEKHIAHVISDNLFTLAEIFPAHIVPELLAIARFAADNLVLANKMSNILGLRDLTDLPETDAPHKHQWLGLASLLLTKSFSWRKRVDADIGFPSLQSIKNAQEKTLHTDYRQRLTAIITELSDREDLRLALTELFFLPDQHYKDKQWDILKALLQVLKMVAAQLRLTFQQHGQIDFVENTQAALMALGNDEHPTDLALALDYQIRHILVDEFQDTSFTQYQLLEKLITGWEPQDGRTLFVVGDPMQSIYRFRQAEVGIFIRMCKSGIGQLNLQPLTLSVNFRSTPSIVEWNNTHFKKIFPLFNDMATGAVSYSPSASLHTESDETKPSTINVRGFTNASEQTQANYVVELIQTIKKNNPEEKIAILARSRSHLSSIIPALKEACISFSAIDIYPLASRQHIQDLLALTCALLHPADRIAWLAVLRAPWCGLTLADLHVIANKHAHATLSEQLECEATLQQLSADGRERLARVYPILKNKIDERERYPFRAWVENTWLLLGGPAYLQDETDLHDAQEYFSLLDDFAENNSMINIDKLKERMDQLFASTQHDGATVQIMTIHTAKGLEFDTVILPHLERKMPSDDKALLLWMERPLINDEIALLLAPVQATGNSKDALYEYINRQQRIKSNYETDRLFYVATTRAKKQLHLLLTLTQDEKGHARIESGSFLEKLWPHIENNLNNILCPNTTENSPTTLTQPVRKLYRLSKAWTHPMENKLKNNLGLHQKQSGFALKDNRSKLIGIVSHRLLQLISQLGITWWSSKTSSAQLDYLQQQLQQAGIMSTQLQTCAMQALHTIAQALQDARGQWILQPHQEARSEFAMTALIDDRMETMVIDRTFVDEKGTRWIIDYKTTAFSQEDVDAFLANEQEKYAKQMDKYARAMRLSETRPIRLGLYFPALPAWKEWEAS
jgi:ATP-dependent helicase/nuclease subunit A